MCFPAEAKCKFPVAEAPVLLHQQCIILISLSMLPDWFYLQVDELAQFNCAQT